MADMRAIWKKIRHRLEVLGMRLLVAAVPRLSREGLLALGHFAGDLVFECDHRGRNVALANLEAAFGDHYLPGERREIIRKSYRNLARTFLDLFWGVNLTPENFRDLVEVTGKENLVPTTSGGPGHLFYSGHFGNFEWLPPILGLLGMPAMSPAQDIKNPAVTPFFLKARSGFGSQPIPQTRAVLRMLKFLKRGGTCGLLVDLTLKLDQPGCLIECFGMKKWVPGVHVSLARLTGATLAPLVCLPLEDGRYEFRFLPPVDLNKELSEEELTQVCRDGLDPVMRAHPECWIWSYKHWRFRPEGAEGYPFYAQTSAKFEKILRGRYSAKGAMSSST